MKLNVPDVPIVYTEHGQSVWEAAEAHGYSPPLHRMGNVYYDQPKNGETLVARVRVGRYGLPLPIFRREVEDE